jgi:hypothetical protein
MSNGKNWMGDGDLGCATDEELRDSVAKIKQGQEEYAALSRLQLEYMEGHDQLAPGVFRTVYSDGTEVVTNYGESEYAYKATVQPKGYRWFVDGWAASTRPVRGRADDVPPVRRRWQS